MNLSATAIAIRIDADRKFEKSKEVQDILRAYVTDKTIPLEKRFNMWKDCCVKIEEPYIIHEGKHGIIGKMVDSCWPCEYDKYATYGWDSFLDWVEDAEKYKYSKEKMEESLGRIVTVEEIKESLIETNFGSFTMDW